MSSQHEYEKYLNSDDLEMRRAFLMGYRAALDVHGLLTLDMMDSRRMEYAVRDNLLRLQEKMTEMGRDLARRLVKNFNLKEHDLCAMLLDCACLNAKGEETEADGSPAQEHHPWPLVTYIGVDGSEIDEADRLGRATRGCKTGLRPVRYMWVRNADDMPLTKLRLDQVEIVSELIRLVMQNWPEEILERCYNQAQPGGDLADYAPLLAELKAKRENALAQLPEGLRELAQVAAEGGYACIING